MRSANPERKTVPCYLRNSRSKPCPSRQFATLSLTRRHVSALGSLFQKKFVHDTRGCWVFRLPAPSKRAVIAAAQAPDPPEPGGQICWNERVPRPSLPKHILPASTRHNEWLPSRSP